MNLSQAIPFDSTSVDYEGDIEAHVASEPMRGMESYQLTGRHAAQTKKTRRTASYVVSDTQEQSFLFHTGMATDLMGNACQDPTSDNAALDAKMQERFRYPLWERGYMINGNISVHGRRKRLYVDGRLFQQSLREHPIPHHNAYQYGLARFRSRFGKRVKLDQVIWLTHPSARFYFHTFNDVMTQLVLADTLGISNDVPVVVDHDWVHQPHAQHFLQSDLLKNRTVVVLEPDHTLVCQSLYMLQPQYFSRLLLDRVCASFPEAKPDKGYNDRLVLIRDQATTTSRSCAGMSNLIDTLTDMGFSALDPATLTIPEQKWVFSRAKHIVAENGSALTNIIFRGGKLLRIDALMAGNFPSITFQCLSKVYGFQHHAHVLPSTRTDKHFRAILTPQVMGRVLAETNKIQKETT